MPAYLVSLPAGQVSRVLNNNIDAVVVFANDTGDAKAMAKAAMIADGNAQWNNADVTAIAAAADFTGFRFDIIQTNPQGAVVKSVSLTATGAAQDTIDEIGAALNTLWGGVSYTSATQVLLLSSAGSGDHSLEVNVYPPTSVGQDAPIPGFVVSKVHQGAAGAALSITFCADGFVVPNLVSRGTLR